MKNHTLIDRVIDVMHRAISRQAFCNTVRIDSATLHRIFKEKEFLPVQAIQLICRAYPEINTRWLLLGEGAFLLPQVAISSDEFRITIRVADESFKLLINRYDEEFYRAATQVLKGKLSVLSIKFPTLTTERMLKIIALKLAVDIEKKNAIAKQMAETNIPEMNIDDKQLYRAAAFVLRKKYDVYYQKYPTYSHRKILAIVTYHFVCKTIN
ncbi:MAG: cell division protein ZapA [Paludibacter sp.]